MKKLLLLFCVGVLLVACSKENESASAGSRPSNTNKRLMGTWYRIFDDGLFFHEVDGIEYAHFYTFRANNTYTYGEEQKNKNRIPPHTVQYPYFEGNYQVVGDSILKQQSYTFSANDYFEDYTYSLSPRADTLYLQSNFRFYPEKYIKKK